MQILLFCEIGESHSIVAGSSDVLGLEVVSLGQQFTTFRRVVVSPKGWSD